MMLRRRASCQIGDAEEEVSRKIGDAEEEVDFPIRIIIPPMRPLQNEHHGTKACNDADPPVEARSP